MSGQPPPLLALRVLVGVAAGCGLLAMSSTLLLPGRLVAMELALTLLTSWTAPALSRRMPSVNARLGCAVVVQIAVLVVGAPQLRTGLDSVLAPLAAMLLAATAVDHTGVRQLVRGLWLGDACLLLTAGVQPEPVLAVPVVLAVVASAGALVAAGAARDAEVASATLVVRPAAGRSRPARLHVRWTVLPVMACLVVSLAGGIGLALLAGANAYGPLGPSASPFLDFGLSPGAGAGAMRRTSAGYGADRLDLRARGELTHDPLYAVPAGSPTLWRGNVLDEYDGAAWSATRPAGLDPAADLVGQGDVRLDPDPLDPPDRAGAPAVYEVRILSGPRSLAPVLAPGPVAGVGPDVRVYRRGDGRLWVRLPDGPDHRYRVTSYPRADTWTGGADSGPGTDPAGTDPADPRWTQLPDGLPQRVRDLSRDLTTGAPDRAAAVRRVENHLRSQYSYELNPPLPRRGQDAVDSFLFDTRAGFCEHFAAAEVVLLRAAGIPARMATGFAGGGVRGGVRVLQGDDSHAWVEVWLPGRGWTSSDPTAGAPLTISAGQRVWASATRPAVRAVALVVVLGLGATALVAVGVAVAFRLRRPGRAGAAGRRAPSAAVPLLAAFERLETALRQAGQERPESETLAELAVRLPDPPGEDGATGAALGILERVLYGPVLPPAERARAAADVLDRVAAHLLADARRKEPALSRPGPGG